MATRRYRGSPPACDERDLKSDPASPCGTCPYRRSTPLGVWDQSEYDRLLKYDAVDPEQAHARARAGEDVPLRDLIGVVYNCHLNDGSVCRGWLADQKRRNVPSIALRLELSRSERLRRTFDAVDPGDPDLYGSVSEMCEANRGRAFPDDDPKAKKLLRLKRGRRRRSRGRR